MSSSLKQQTISGIFWAAIQKFGTLGISFISNIILARLLTPDDYGCLGLLAIFIVIAEVFVNGGFATALIQKKESTHKDYCTVFYWNIFVSVLFYFILFYIAPIVASYYNIPLLIPILRIQGLILLTNSLSIVQLNILRKQLKFKKMSIIQFVSVLISVVVGILLAYNGWGVWSLVIQQLLNSSITSLILWITSQWKPDFTFSFNSFKELFNYGSFLLLSDLLNSICDNIQGLIIGRKYSSCDMGYYTQAKKLETVPTQSISYVVNIVTLPVFAKLQENKQQLYVAVRKSIRLINYLNIPLMVLLILVSEPLIILLFSDKWIESIPFFRILCLSGIINCSQSINYQVVCAVGRSRDIFKWNILKRLLGIVFIFIGINWGIQGMLYGMVCNLYLSFIINALVATISTGYSLYQQIKDLCPIILLSIITALTTYIIIQYFTLNFILDLVLKILVYISLFIVFSKIINRIEFIEYLNIIRSVKK